MDDQTQIPDNYIIKESDYIVIQKADKLMLHKLNKKTLISIFGKNIDLKSIIGKPYCSTFKMEFVNKRQCTLRYCAPDEVEQKNFKVPSTTNDPNSQQQQQQQQQQQYGNSIIVDDNKSQLLTRDDIMKMKDGGVSSHEILQNIIDNSKSFSVKTEYSQEKYINKKASKYTDYVRILKPNLRLLLQVYSKQKSQKSLFTLRFDILSTILTYANIDPKGKYILYEGGSQGIVMASMLARMSPDAKIFNIVFPSEKRDKKFANALGLSREKLDQVINVYSGTTQQSVRVCTRRMRRPTMLPRKVPGRKFSNSENNESRLNLEIEPVAADESGNSVENDRKEEEEIVAGTDGETKLQDDKSQITSVCLDRSGNKTKRASAKRIKRSSVQSKRPHSVLGKAIESELEEKVDGLIVVCKHIPNKLVKNLIKFVKPSRPFVIYSQYQNVLTDLYFELKQQGNVVHVKLFENWLRFYQVLEKRTHPKVSMNAAGGYLLTGLVVDG